MLRTGAETGFRIRSGIEQLTPSEIRNAADRANVTAIGDIAISGLKPCAGQRFEREPTRQGD